MRIILLLSIVSLALSGCASSGTGMYSVPTNRRVCSSPQNTRSISYEPIQIETIAYARHESNYRQAEQITPQPKQQSKPAPKKVSRKNKNILNEAMGVSYKLFKDGIRYIKPKIARLGK